MNYLFNTRQFRTGSFKESFQKGFFAKKRTYKDALDSAYSFRAKYDEFFREFDLWLTPVSTAEAINHQKTGSPQLHNSKEIPYAAYIGNFLMPTALLHHPILTAPMASSESGLPIGIQLHGKRGEDWQLLSDSSKLSALFCKPRGCE